MFTFKSLFEYKIFVLILFVKCFEKEYAAHTASGCVFFYPGDILIHPVLQEFFAVCADVTGFIKQPILDLNESIGLAKRWYVQSGENVAQMLLCHGRADDAGRKA
jgi:hypothetical protein